jgi:hypothetical protein
VTKTIPDWASRALTVVGGVLIASMFLNWIDFGPFTQSGFTLAEDKRWLWLVPISGAVLCLAAATKSPFTRLAAMFAGVLVTGDVLFNVGKSVLDGGLEGWLLFGGAGALLAGASEKRKDLRVIGGLAVIAGFVAPWTSDSMFRTLLDGDKVEAASCLGIHLRVMWLLPVAGIAAIAGAAHPQGGKIAIGAGIAVYGSILYIMLSAARLVFGYGAWAALGASVVALVLGVLAPSGVAAAVAKATGPAKKSA